VEVLIALAITAMVGAMAYASLTSVIEGTEGNREVTERTHEINRAWMLLTRDIRAFVPRPVRDEFGQFEPALNGGRAARFPLSLTRAGWHNPQLQQRSTLQRVNYVVEDNALWRESYVVLDRAPDTEARRVKLLDGVEVLEVVFLDDLASLRAGEGVRGIDTRDWNDTWIADTGNPNTLPEPPAVLEVRLQLEDLGEMRRLYALPPL
jgi:general secretion pathway protein J